MQGGCSGSARSSGRSIVVSAKRVPLIVVTAVLVLLPQIVSAQGSPWERAASNLERTFTGPLARSLALVAIVVGGLTFMFGEMGAKRQLAGIVFGGGLALFAAQFLVWLF
jgi:type IV secretory pathway VirB2 component (pilin)